MTSTAISRTLASIPASRPCRTGMEPVGICESRMRNILFLLPSLDYHGDTRQASLLAGAVPRDRFLLSGASTGGDGPLRSEFNRIDVAIEWYAGHRFIDVLKYGGLRSTVRDRRPDVIHVWGLDALRALRLAMLGRWKRLPPLIVSSAGRSIWRGRLNWWKRRLLGRGSRLVVSFEDERDALSEVGIDPGLVTIIPPGVQPALPVVNGAALRHELGVPSSARLIMSAGRMDSVDRFRNAIWAFDILKYIAKDIWLVLIGSGEARTRLENFGRSIGPGDFRVAFAGARPDAASLLHHAEVVWVANRQQGGTNVAMEAMAAGKPVVASSLPNLAGIIRDGETGFLVSPRDPPALARRTL